MDIKNRTVIFIIVLIAIISFFVWRFIRPMNIYVVSEAFERPIDTSTIPAPLRTLRATECATCHSDFYDEWRTTIHSQAWTDPYFQADWKFENKQQTCKNCHIPLDRQQEHKVLGFRDKEKWDPILAPNPQFDPKLQHEGVTCAACHLREGKIVGVYGDTQAPHPVRKLDDPNQVCVRCHVVKGERWDTFFRIPPCGTVAEITATKNAHLSRQDIDLLLGAPKINTATKPDQPVPLIETPQTPESPPVDKEITGAYSEITASNIKGLGCVQCHMPLVKRPLVVGGKPRLARRHLWRGGHDPEMVKRGLEISFQAASDSAPGKRGFILTVTNVGAAHYLPTGTPDRHLTVSLRLLDKDGGVLKQEIHTLKRTIMWRPFIVDLWDTRLLRWQPRRYRLDIPEKQNGETVEAVVRYHLVAEKRLKRIGYKSEEPLAYDVFRKQIPLRIN
ncbi:MAG: hypothetical protein GXP09_01095 [Gammaproteobacteria bacterium]|nr:hypothetical protein [Gammaproteobacteria bacterium]